MSHFFVYVLFLELPSFICFDIHRRQQKHSMMKLFVLSTQTSFVVMLWVMVLCKCM